MIRSTIFAVLTLLMLATAANAVTDREQAMIDRLSPIGTVCMAGDACAAPAVAAAPSGPQEPEALYNTYCMACHMTGVSGSPIVGNTEHWVERIAKGKETLYESVFNGLATDGVYLMPARGLCMSCTDEELMATVDMMVSKSQ